MANPTFFEIFDNIGEHVERVDGLVLFPDYVEDAVVDFSRESSQRFCGTLELAKLFEEGILHDLLEQRLAQYLSQQGA